MARRHRPRSTRLRRPAPRVCRNARDRVRAARCHRKASLAHPGTTGHGFVRPARASGWRYIRAASAQGVHGWRSATDPPGSCARRYAAGIPYLERHRRIMRLERGASCGDPALMDRPRMRLLTRIGVAMRDGEVVLVHQDFGGWSTGHDPTRTCSPTGGRKDGERHAIRRRTADLTDREAASIPAGRGNVDLRLEMSQRSRAFFDFSWPAAGTLPRSGDAQLRRRARERYGRIPSTRAIPGGRRRRLPVSNRSPLRRQDPCWNATDQRSGRRFGTTGRAAHTSRLRRSPGCRFVPVGTGSSAAAWTRASGPTGLMVAWPAQQENRLEPGNLIWHRFAFATSHHRRAVDRDSTCP